MALRSPTAYQTAWLLAEQPTTILTGITSGTFGNLIQANAAGQLVGLRWGRTSNVTDKGCIGAVFSAQAPTAPLRVCMAAPRVSDGVAGVVRWINMYFHPFLRLTPGTVYMLAVHPLLAPINYNDGQLLNASFTQGQFTWPQDQPNPHNGSTNTGAFFYPSTAANGRRHAVDVLWLPG